MVQLTPFEETTAAKQIYARGLACGILSGQIHFAQQLLKQPPTPKEELKQKTEVELQSILQQLEVELKSSLRIQ